MVATSYGSLAVQQLELGHTGLMVAPSKGVYTTVPVDACTQGVKRVDVAGVCTSEQYRPRWLSNLPGKPMYRYQARAAERCKY
ncbi:MAG: hypothetical protein U0074_07625 [Kouleothrix sp.]